MIKLYKILFEQEEQLKLLSPEQMKAPKSAFSHIPKIGGTDYVAPAFAMVDWWDGSEQGFALFHVEKFHKWIADGMYAPFERWLCAYAGSNERHQSDCNGAVEVNYMVRSPEFPGAGAAMYALVSDYYKAPITSDRQSSTSNSAKKAWAKIESSSEWTKVDLDNWKEDSYDNKTWYRINGSWPNRSITSSDEPATPDDESDDCSIPKAGTSDGLDRKLGTANAWMYNGSLDAESLISNGQEVLNSIADEFGGTKAELEREIKSKSSKLFTKYYRGIDG